MKTYRLFEVNHMWDLWACLSFTNYMTWTSILSFLLLSFLLSKVKIPCICMIALIDKRDNACNDPSTEL